LPIRSFSNRIVTDLEVTEYVHNSERVRRGKVRFLIILTALVLLDVLVEPQHIPGSYFARFAQLVDVHSEPRAANYRAVL
jgi:hypothetical protein